jgi:O-antigen ligase
MGNSILEEKQKIRLAYTLSGIFLLLSTYLIATEKYWYIAFIPAVLALVWMYVYRLDWVLLLITFTTPVAVELSDLDLGVSVSLPSEPLMFGVLLLALLKLLFEGNYDMRIVRHPVTLVVFFSLLWMFFTSMTSELPVVSFKYLLSRLWFVVPFYFLGILLFKRFKNIKTFNWLYIIPMIYVIIHTTRVHAAHGFSEDVSHWAMSPFYNDHTAYGAILALLLPFTLVSTFFKRYPVKYRVAAGVVSFILLVALFLSNSRAAWLSFIGAFGVLMFILLKIRFRYVFLVLAVLVGLFYSFKPQIIDYLEDNKQDSSGDFKEHVQSMYNISTDASNLERLNRWQSALRLFEERPVMGWGPGTYQFVYAPFQRSKEKTIISTNFGDMGNAHSEYLGPLSESGVLGAVYILLLAFVGLNRGLIVYRKAANAEVRMMALAALLGLTTYWIHGFLNIFLDTDKLSVPVWGYLAIIVALDIYHRDKAPADFNQE